MQGVSFRHLKRCSGKVSAKVSSMLVAVFRSHFSSLAASTRLGAGVCCLALAFSAWAQEPAAQPAQPDSTQQPAQAAQPPDAAPQAATPEAQSNENKKPAAT